MVTIIGSGEVIRGALSYNENKVKDGDAVLLAAVKYPKDADKLSFKEKLNVLQRQADLRPSVDHNCVHISINFDPSDKLSNEKLLAIAEQYMDGIGFGDQPYLVYSHTDAAHPHLHIVSTSITADGNLIRLHNLGKTVSSAVREKLELEFNLVRARGRNSVSKSVLRPSDLTKAQYGKRPTKAEISNVVRSVFHHFKYTSFGEFNAALNAFDVVADTGSPGMQMHEKGGLLYFLLDPAGNKIGKPIKASSIYDEPILKKIKAKFENNSRKRDDYKARVCRIIDDVLSKGVSEAEFLNKLDAYDISAIFRKSKDGRVYGITYVDRKTFYVFNGSDLGERNRYAASSIMKNLRNENSSADYIENERLATDGISQTYFENGVKSVMVQWMSRGLLLDAKYGDGGNCIYALGRWNTQKDNYSTLSPRLSRYLQINSITPERVDYLRKEFLNSSPDLVDATLQTIKEVSEQKLHDHLTKLVDECFEATSAVRSISSALLKEAKKKRKRKRH